MKMVDAYMSRIETRLRRRMSADEAKDCIDELRGHLDESVSEMLAEGRSERVATELALRNLGHFKVVADGLIRVKSGIAAISNWRIAWVSMVVLLTYDLLPQLFPFTLPVPEWELTLTLWLPTAFLALFAFACWRSRRLLLWPIVTTVLTVFALNFLCFVLLDPMGYTSISRALNRNDVRNFERVGIDYGSRIEAAKSATETGALDSTLRQGSDFLAPIRGVAANEGNIVGTPIIVSEGKHATVYLAPVANKAEALRRWRRIGPAYVQELEVERESNVIGQQDYKRTRSDTGFILEVAKQMLIWSGNYLGIMLFVNLVVIWAVRLRQSLLNRRWRPQRLA